MNSERCRRRTATPCGRPRAAWCSPSPRRALFATGVGARPAGLLWDRLYDVVLFDAPYLFAAAVCWLAGPAGSGPSAPRGAPLAIAFAAQRRRQHPAHLGHRDGRGRGLPARWPTSFDLAGYLTALRRRSSCSSAPGSPRFHPSMWLDGVIGALGTTAVGVAFLIGPVPRGSGRRRPPPAADRTGHADDRRPAAGPAGRGRVDPRGPAGPHAAAGHRGAVLRARRRRRPVRPHGRRHVRRRRPAGPDLAGRHLPGRRSRRTGARPQPARTRRRAPASAGGCSRCRWSATWPAWSCWRWAGATACRSSPPGWPSAACWPPSPGRPSPSARSARFNEVRQQARTDELSGLPNRRALLEAAERMLDDATAARSRPRCSCWTWTGSRRSTTAWATTPATTCSARSARGCEPALRRRRAARPASAATSSPSSCPTPASTRRRRAPSDSAS